eukprot:TRINITY_DN5161_c0_g1_i1.p1 TRINITY_DN5161_c0_g1~~TRINITY_DN5161_c0_g1_i1.p1  ORF type:complete len:151 (-),score=48.37 TRINITY_DN5161_c0_g1_i1:160-549(-)
MEEYDEEDAEIQKKQATLLDNSRYKCLRFTTKEEATTLYGLAGYFEAQLYKDVYLSIYPPTANEGMFSWFPIYFPIKAPIYVPAHSEIEVHMWRCTSATKVWYEWCVIADSQQSGIHNALGKAYSIGKF